MDSKKFYDYIRKHIFKKIGNKQFENIELILTEWSNRKLTDVRMLAYILATAYHETAGTMQPVKEYGLGKGKKYGLVHAPTGKIYYGRGHVQLTWDWNYKKMSKYVPGLYENPDLALVPANSIKIMFEGMLQGLFTTKKLSDYFNDKPEPKPLYFYKEARRIVNGKDKAALIASYAMHFENAIKQSVNCI